VRSILFFIPNGITISFETESRHYNLSLVPRGKVLLFWTYEMYSEFKVVLPTPQSIKLGPRTKDEMKIK
jgi:hypothetical protein